MSLTANEILLSSISLDDKFASYFAPGGIRQEALTPLGKINIFVGENNSGKSRFLRLLMGRKITFGLSPIKLDEANDLIRFVKKSVTDVLKGGFHNANRYYEGADQLDEVVTIIEDTDFLEPLRTYARHINAASQGGNDTSHWTPQKGAAIKQIGVAALDRLSKIQLPQKFVFPKLYIPTLRGLRDLEAGKDVYQIRTQADYFKEESPAIFTGLSLYGEYRRMLLGTFTERRWIGDFERFLGNSFFNGKRITIIPRDENRALEVQIGNDKQRSVAELGDGIHSVIIMTFPLFQRQKEPLLVFFEEPELYLHPALQRIFLSTLKRPEFAKHQYFLTTHSNHFLDLTADVTGVSIFAFHRHDEHKTSEDTEEDSKFTLENVSNDDSRTLALLGVRNSSVFLSNCTIWVEGITDRRYLACWLSVFAQHSNGFKFKEDLHFSFVEYSGSNITHWSFLDDVPDPVQVERLCGKLFLISDNDAAKEGSKKSERFKRLKAKLGERFAQLECREIENLLPPDVIKSVVAEYEGENAVLQDFAQNDYKGAYLGTFIEEKVISGQRRRKGSYADDPKRPSTISDKVGFCARAIPLMINFDKLSQELKA